MIAFNPTAPRPKMSYDRNDDDLKKIIARADAVLELDPRLHQDIVASYKKWIRNGRKEVILPTHTLRTLEVNGNPCFFVALILGSFIKEAKNPYIWDATVFWFMFICKGYKEMTGKKMLSSSVRLVAWALGAPAPTPVDYRIKPKPVKDQTTTLKDVGQILFDTNQVESSWAGHDPLTNPDRTLFNRAVEAQKWAKEFKKENSVVCDELLKAFKAHRQGKPVSRKLVESLGDMRRKPSRFCCLLLSLLEQNADVKAADFIKLYAKIFGHELNHTQLMMCARIMNLKKPESKRSDSKVANVTSTAKQTVTVETVPQPEPIPTAPTDQDDVITGDCDASSPEIFIPANKGCNIRVTQSEGTIEITISFK